MSNVFQVTFPFSKTPLLTPYHTSWEIKNRFGSFGAASVASSQTSLHGLSAVLYDRYQSMVCQFLPFDVVLAMDLGCYTYGNEFPLMPSPACKNYICICLVVPGLLISDSGFFNYPNSNFRLLIRGKAGERVWNGSCRYFPALIEKDSLAVMHFRSEVLG